MADQTRDLMERLYGHQSELRGGFQGLGQGQGPIPFRPPGQPPSALPKSMYVDQVEDGHATVVGPDGRAVTVPVQPGSVQEGRMSDGSAAPETAHPHYLPWPDDGIIRLGESLPKVPLAPGSPGQPVAPGMNQMLDRKPDQQKKKRRPTP